jgi:transcription termination factor NusB
MKLKRHLLSSSMKRLEIARKFSTSESIHFINGILDSIRKESEEPKP